MALSIEIFFLEIGIVLMPLKFRLFYITGVEPVRERRLEICRNQKEPKYFCKISNWKRDFSRVLLLVTNLKRFLHAKNEFTVLFAVYEQMTGERVSPVNLGISKRKFLDSQIALQHLITSKVVHLLLMNSQNANTILNSPWWSLSFIVF